MKKNLPLILILFSINIYAQRELNYERFLIAGEKEGTTLISDYLNPGMKGMMITSGSSWYSTAETHAQFGYDIALNTSSTFIPSSGESFKFNTSFNNIYLPDGETSLPTVAGSTSETPLMMASLDNDGNTLTAGINAPTGVGISPNVTPYTMLQLGFGVGWGTDIKFRFVPKLGYDSFKTGMWGIALQHDVFQYIPYEGKVPVHISILGGYSSTTAKWTLDPVDSQWAGSDQHTDFKVRTWTFQLLASTTFSIFDIYTGLGYDTSKSSYNMKGSYEVEYNTNYNSNDITKVTYSNPANGNFKYRGFNATFGTRINIKSFKIFADYSFNSYNSLTLGIAYSVN
ncbi:MAG: DUF6588 family protein [Bacteroidota bacterium]